MPLFPALFKLITALLSFFSLSVANAEFKRTDERLNALYDMDGYFITMPSDGFFFNGESCKRNFQEKSGLYGLQRFQPGYVEVITLFGPKARFYRPPSYGRPAARYRVIATDPLTFDVEMDTGGSFLVQRYVFMPDYNLLRLIKGVECRNCVGGQKYAFDMIKDETREINFCTGRP